MLGKVVAFLHPAEPEPAERAALEPGTTVRRGQGYTLRVSTKPEVHRQFLNRCQPLDNATAIPAQREAGRGFVVNPPNRARGVTDISPDLPAAEHRPDRARRSLQSSLMTKMTTRTVEYPADGLTMIGYLALPAGVDRRPAVLLGPEGMGLSDVERRRADALAELGYVALAFDLHGGRYLGDPEEMLARCMPLLADPDRMRGIGHAALDVLRTEPRTDPDRIAAVGYGTGGAIALELGRDGANLRAIGTVNATTTGRPGEAARIRCPVWAGVGSEDPIMPPAQRNAFTAEMQAAGVDWRLAVYGGALHAFHHPPVDHPVVPGVGYHPQHAQRAWRDVVDLLTECLPLAENLGA